MRKLTTDRRRIADNPTQSGNVEENGVPTALDARGEATREIEQRRRRRATAH
jgi:hypothetical protein